MKYQRKFQGKLLYDLKLPMNICFLLEMSCWWQLFSYSFGNHGHKLLSLFTFSHSELYRGVLLVYNRHGLILVLNLIWSDLPTLLPPATKLGQGYLFTGVCDFVNRGVSASVHAGIPPGSRHPLGADPAVADTPPGSRHPQEQTPREQTPPRSRHTPLGADTPPPCRAWREIQSTRGRYASYWNAILYQIFIRT